MTNENHDKKPNEPAEKTEKKPVEPKHEPAKVPPPRRTAQSIDDLDRAAGEGMGQAQYGPPPSTGKP
jgi:hypothetical protein